MEFAEDVAGVRVRPTPRAMARCPQCKQPVRAKCGRIVPEYWSHLVGNDCDSWSEPETLWHRWWKARVPVEQREVVVGDHRADIVNSDGVVVELQHSPLSVDDIAERENHYAPIGTERNMIWLLDGRTLKAPMRYFNSQVVRLEQVEHTQWLWRWARHSFKYARCPVYIDLGTTVLRAHLLRGQGRGFLRFPGREAPRDHFLRMFKLAPAPEQESPVSYIARFEGLGRTLIREFPSMADAAAAKRRRAAHLIELADLFAWHANGTVAPSLPMLPDDD
jgi:competence protein CoiA